MAVLTGPELFERDHDLEALDALLADARAGRGALVLIEAPAGQGKTSLIRAARSRAGEAGMRTLSAIGAHLERDFAFGVVRQLFDAILREAPDDVFAGAAAMAAPIFDLGDGSGSDGVDASHARLHGLFWLCSNLAQREPLVLTIDDAHWADAPSLRFVDVVARRIEDLPLVVILGARPAEPGAEQALLDDLLAAPTAVALRPAPLTADAVAVLAARALGRDPDPGFVAMTATSTGGNPLFVRELLRAAVDAGLTGAAAEAQALQRLAPDTVTRMVVARLRRLPPAAIAVARAVCVLGERATLGRVATLAGIGRADAVAGADVLARAAVLERDRLVFAHPIVREAVHAGLGGVEERAWHRAAARLLAGEGLRDSEVAPHLAASDPEGDPWAARVLAEAGHRALSDGAPDVAQRLLARALEEPPPDAERPRVLLELGRAEARIGDASALEHLAEAAATSEDLVTRAQAAELQAYVMIGRDDAARAADVLREALGRRHELPGALRQELEEHYLEALHYRDDDLDEYLGHVRECAAEERPAALAHDAWMRASAGAPVDEVLAIARRAIADGSLLRSVGAEQYSAYYAIEALMVCEAADEAQAALVEAFAAARRAGSPFMLATLSFMRPTWERQFGDLRRAEAELRDGLALFERSGARHGATVSRVNLVGVLLARGDVDEADALLAALPEEERDVGSVGLHAARARAHAERGRWERALAECELQYAHERRRRAVLSHREPTRLTQVRALLALRRREEAIDVADAEVELHTRRGAPGAQAVAQLALGLALGGDDGVASLRTAVACAERSPVRLVEAQARAELGSALRRLGHRTDARDPLRRARDLARRCGARALEAWTHEELVIAGARPQRVALDGVDALTNAERRVADLAAQGLSNREIAETLFVTLKTVEVHLGRTYGKLSIKGRSQLTAALGGTEVSAAARGA